MVIGCKKGNSLFSRIINLLANVKFRQSSESQPLLIRIFPPVQIWRDLALLSSFVRFVGWAARVKMILSFTFGKYMSGRLLDKDRILEGTVVDLQLILPDPAAQIIPGSDSTVFVWRPCNDNIVSCPRTDCGSGPGRFRNDLRVRIRISN